jgi:hypothetical protein
MVPLSRPSIRLIALLAAIAAGAGCREPLGAADPVILALGDQAVRRSDFERHVAQLEARGGAPLAPEVREALLGPFLEERAVVLEARARGLVAAGAPPEQEQAAAQRLLAEVTAGDTAVSESEIEAHYSEHAADYRHPETVSLRQILVPTSNEARDVRRRLQKEPKAFELLARTRSRGPEASTGGVMGTYSRGQLPAELEQAAFALGAGATSDVVESSLGYHVLRVDAREDARDQTLEECRGRIQAELARRKSEKGVSDFVRGLLARAKVNHEAAKTAPRR